MRMGGEGVIGCELGMGIGDWIEGSEIGLDEIGRPRLRWRKGWGGD